MRANDKIFRKILRKLNKSSAFNNITKNIQNKEKSYCDSI